MCRAKFNETKYKYLKYGIHIYQILTTKNNGEQVTTLYKLSHLLVKAMKNIFNIYFIF